METDSMLKKLGAAFFAVLVSFVACAVFLVLLGHNPLMVFKTIFDGSLKNTYAVAKSLAKCTPLIFTGLSFLIANKAGLFNIGAEGQLLIGGIAAGVLSYWFSAVGVYAPLAILLAIVLSFIAGGLWGMVPGCLKAYRGANEFIVSMMLNYVASFLCEYLVTYVFRGPGVLARTHEIPSGYQLARLVAGSQFNLGFFIGIICVVLLSFFLNRTSQGFEIKAMGLNRNAARSAGVDLRKKTVLSFFLSGGLAALAGATEVMGVQGFFLADLSPGYGYDGIAVSVLAQGNPFGVVLSAFLFGALRAGGSRLDLKSDIPSEFIIILQALVIACIATPQLLSWKRRKKDV